MCLKCRSAPALQMLLCVQTSRRRGQKHGTCQGSMTLVVIWARASWDGEQGQSGKQQ